MSISTFLRVTTIVFGSFTPWSHSATSDWFWNDW